MLNLNHLVPLRNKSLETLARVKARAEQLDQAVAKIEDDTSRSSDWKRTEIARIKSDSLGSMGSDLAFLKSNAAEVVSSKAAYLNTVYLLSLQKFDGDIGVNAAMRLAASSELAQMPDGLRKMVTDNALEEGNRPLIYQAWLATPQGERADIDLSLVVIPDRGEALQAISEVLQAVPQGELYAKSALASSSTRIGSSALDRMQVAREINSLAA